MDIEDQYLIEHDAPIQWISQRIDEMYLRPRMWSVSDESFELQILNYFELLGFLIYKDYKINQKYRNYIVEITGSSSVWLFQLPSINLIESLKQFQIKFKLTLNDYEELMVAKIKKSSQKSLSIIKELNDSIENAKNLLDKFDK